MDRQETLSLVKSHVQRANLFKHILAVEAILRALAQNLNKDADRWALLGLLHDIDFDETYDKPEVHAKRSVEILTGKVDSELLRAIEAHNYEQTGIQPRTEMEKALIAADAVSGLGPPLIAPGRGEDRRRPGRVGRRPFPPHPEYG